MAGEAELILNRAIELGNEKSEMAESLTLAAITASQGRASLNLTKLAPAGATVAEPQVTIPRNATGVDSALFSSTYQRIIDDLSSKYAAFLTEFFPIDADLMSSVEQWLTRAVRDGGTGVNATVEAQLWQRDRDRITTESLTAIDEVIGVWASRGYPLPPGAANASVQAINRKRATDINNQSRDVMIKSWEMELDTVKFAVTTAVSYRSQAIQAAGDYIRAMALGPQLATQLATAAAGAQSQLISAASSYYNARVSVAELAQRRELAIADRELSAQTVDVQTAQRYSENRTNAAIAAAKTLGDQASAALNAVSATAQIIQAVS